MSRTSSGQTPGAPGGVKRRAKGFRSLVAVFLVGVLLVFGIPIAVYFPRATDRPPSLEELARTRDFYAKAYEKAGEDKPDPQQEIYVKVAEMAAQDEGILEKVAGFVSQYQLKSRKVLDVGAGRGQLQDLVDDYTGLDISSSARRFFHKPFVQGSATAMPFTDNSFDAAWSIWVLEHVPNPEQMLREMRRVVKGGGLIYLRPAWDCKTWAAKGYDVLPYSRLDLPGKVGKASIGPRLALIGFAKPPIRYIRYTWITMAGGPSTLHYTRLEPNYEKFMQPDSDAVNSVDWHEAAMWFASRGDQCLNCNGPRNGIDEFYENALIIRLKKP